MHFPAPLSQPPFARRITAVRAWPRPNDARQRIITV
jgi:hypothetical protein